MRKIVSIVMVIAIVASLFTYSVGASNFIDVPSNAWYSDAISWGVYHGITKGTSSRTFSPEKPVTRAEAITLIYRFIHDFSANGFAYTESWHPWHAIESDGIYSLIAKERKNSVYIPFEDVDMNSWYGEALQWARDGGYRNAIHGNELYLFYSLYDDNYPYPTDEQFCIINGTSETTFEPDRPVTRAEFATMLMRVLVYNEMSMVHDIKREGSIAFEDVHDSDWFVNQVCILNRAGVINGVTATSFAPNNNCTRAEVIQMLYNTSNSIRNNGGHFYHWTEALHRLNDEDYKYRIYG